MNEQTSGSSRQPGATEHGTHSDTAGVIAHPPVIYLLAILTGLGLHALWPVDIVPHALEAPVGAVLIALAVLLIVAALREFNRAGTPAPTHQPTTALVTTGPYRYTRNPIYVSFTLLHLGIAVWVNSVWLLATLVVALVIMRYGVIAREERYLARKFGDAYLRYTQSVRRWV